jgi:DNA-binding transcriptional LysR family regulator
MTFLAQTPFDLYELALFQLVGKHRRFTKAAALAGLIQSAMTRQIQGMERALGIPLLNRSTRSLAPTPAGEFLLREASRLIGDVESTLRRLREDFAGAPKEIRVDVSRSISLAYLPGFFHASLRKLANVTYRVRFSATPEILFRLEADEQDVGVLCPPRKLPSALRITHRFTDVFAIIAPASAADDFHGLATEGQRRDWLAEQRWLLYDEKTITGEKMRQWIKRSGYRLKSSFDLDNFDLIVNLVALGMGAGFVPARTLALYANKKGFKRLRLPKTFARELAVVIRKRANPPPHLSEFVSSILF